VDGVVVRGREKHTCQALRFAQCAATLAVGAELVRVSAGSGRLRDKRIRTVLSNPEPYPKRQSVSCCRPRTPNRPEFPVRVSFYLEENLL
jgi:hypothetical protein